MATVKPIVPPYTDDEREISLWSKRVCDLLSYQTYAGVPTNNVVPRWVGDRCLDTSNDDWYVAHGTASANWKVTT